MSIYGNDIHEKEMDDVSPTSAVAGERLARIIRSRDVGSDRFTVVLPAVVTRERKATTWNEMIEKGLHPERYREIELSEFSPVTSAFLDGLGISGLEELDDYCSNHVPPLSVEIDRAVLGKVGMRSEAFGVLDKHARELNCSAVISLIFDVVES